MRKDLRMLDTDKLLELERKRNNGNELSSDELLELADLEKELYSALERCTSMLIRETIIKRYIEGKTWEKIATDMFDLTSDAPRKRASRGLEKLSN